MWLKNEKCEEVVHRAWEEGLLRNSAFPLNSCLESCRVCLDDWNKNDFGHVGQQIARLQKTLQWLELQPTSPSIITEIQKTRVELNCWLDKDNAMWLQRSRINWFQEGDRNTGYFHSKASARFQNNIIEGMEDSGGTWQEDMGIVEGIIVDYYSALFSSSNPMDFMELIDAVEPKVTSAMNQMLLRDFQDGEMKTTLKQMYPLKAPGPDVQSKSQYLRLYLAALEGNCQDANQILRVEAVSDAIQYSITRTNESILHVAFASKHMAFIKGVVQVLSDDHLELKNVDGDTALCFAAKSGIVPIAKLMVKKNNKLPLIRSSEGRTPLHQAALLGRRDMVSYLFSVTPLNELTLDERMEILVATITHDMYDIALKILGTDETLAIANDGKNIAALHELARKHSRSQLSLCKPCFKSSFMQELVHALVARVSREVKLFEDKQFSCIVRTLLFDAVEFGNTEFLDILIGSYPNIIWTIDNHRRSLLHIAVKNRQESVFNLIYETVAAKEIILTYVDGSKQNILHLAGELAPPRRLNIVSGAALQMQRELLWFKEVEKIVPPLYLNMKNSKGQTPGDIFTEKHEHLQKEGKEWMKDTANNCMIVATLITTVVFTAAFTVPGGSNQETGIPILLESIWFTIFFISDAIALLSSSSSILIFLSILTSRFTEMDFLVSLPSKLVLGLTTLFISIAGMLVSFSATCFLVYKSKMVRFPIVIISLAGVPIILFIFLHYKLWTDIIRSICLSMFLFRRRKNKLFLVIQ